MAQFLRANPSALRLWLQGQSAAGVVLMASAALALILANSPLHATYEAVLHARIGPMSAAHWINDGLMAIFFLYVGLEIKREVLDGQLSTWSRRALPSIAAAGGMIVPAMLYVGLNRGPESAGWAIPAATDIAFALGVIALLGSRVPASLRIFLAALAIIDDLGAILVIALFYTAEVSLPALAGAGAATLLLAGLNRFGVRSLGAYLPGGILLWTMVLLSGIHATLAGVILAFTIPLVGSPGRPDEEGASPLHRLEHRLQKPVAFLVLPIFGLANAGVPFLSSASGALMGNVGFGVALGLAVGKLAGVFGFSLAAIRLKWADMPAQANVTQLFGVALLCGIGFTMSLFITLLAFPGNTMLQDQARLGIIAGSLLSALLGYAVLRAGGKRKAAPARPG